MPYNYNPPNSINQLTSSQSQVLYSQHYPMPVRKLDNTHQKTQQQPNTYDTSKNEIGLHLISQPGLINHPNFYHQFNRPVSPAKSTSISEISPYAYHNSNKQLHRPNGNQQQSGVVVYYSPEEASNSLMITDLDNVSSKFASETELQKLKEHLIYNSPESRSGDQQSNSNKKSYFFSKRPVSFKKALEITEQFEKGDRNTHLPTNKKGANKSSAPNEGTSLTIDSNKDDNRHSQYEISV